MTITVARFQPDESEKVRNLTKSHFYRTLTGSTASTELVGELPDFPSLSMLPRRNGEQGTPLLVLVYYETREGGLEGNPEIKAKLSQPGLWQHPEPDASVWRGVYAPRRRRPILFSQEVEFQMADLPRRKRHIAITPRMLASEENDAGREEH